MQGYICKYCINYFENEEIPPMSILNGLFTNYVPDVIKNLNLYEKLLIQRVKPFQSVQKLENVGKKKYTSLGKN